MDFNFNGDVFTSGGAMALSEMFECAIQAAGTFVAVHVNGSDKALKAFLKQGHGTKAPGASDFKLEFFIIPDKGALEGVAARFDSKQTSSMARLVSMDPMKEFFGVSSPKSVFPPPPDERDYLEQWRNESWGSPTDTRDVKLDQRFEYAELSFKIEKAPKEAFRKLSEAFPELTFDMRICRKGLGVHDLVVFEVNRFVFSRGQCEQRKLEL